MSAGTHAVLVLAGALALDLAFGEPPRLLHPVVWMGRFQRSLRRFAPRQRAPAFLYGALMAVVGPSLFGMGAWALIRLLAPWPPAQFLVEVYLLKSAFAVRELASAALAVARALAAGELAKARLALQSLVSRDTGALLPPLLAGAAVESVAENASDSFIAPLLYYAFLGVPGAIAYRAANTLDALIGYHGETEWLGKVAARLDDLLNLIPARCTAALLIPAAAICRASSLGALRVWWQDGGATESPNAGHPMAAMAGALGVRLEKVGHYSLGRGTEPGASEIRRAVAILWVVSALAAGLTFAFVGFFDASVG